MFLPIKGAETLPRELREDFVITKELSTFAEMFALRCGRLLMVANTAQITIKHIDFQRTAAKGYPVSAVDEVPSQQSSPNAKQLASIAD